MHGKWANMAVIYLTRLFLVFSSPGKSRFNLNSVLNKATLYQLGLCKGQTVELAMRLQR